VLGLVGFVGLSLLVGAAGGSVALHGAHGWFAALTPPAGMPPHWLFAPLWIVLYTGVGAAGWMVWRRCGAARPVRLWGWQLAANALWTPAFFGLHNFPLTLACLALLLGLIALTLRAFHRLQPFAAGLLVPFLLWSLYSAYLVIGFWWSNPV
jgi:tryptophan-rich sensory protein